MPRAPLKAESTSFAHAATCHGAGAQVPGGSVLTYLGFQVRSWRRRSSMTSATGWAGYPGLLTSPCRRLGAAYAAKHSSKAGAGFQHTPLHRNPHQTLTGPPQAERDKKVREVRKRQGKAQQHKARMAAVTGAARSKKSQRRIDHKLRMMEKDAEAKAAGGGAACGGRQEEERDAADHAQGGQEGGGGGSGRRGASSRGRR